MFQPINYDELFANLQFAPRLSGITHGSILTGYCWSNFQAAGPNPETALWAHYGISKDEFAAAEFESGAVLDVSGEDILLEGEPEEAISWEWYFVRRGLSRWMTYALYAADRSELFIGQCMISAFRHKLESIISLLLCMAQPQSPVIWDTENNGKVLSPWRFACIQNHSPGRLRTETVNVFARIGLPYELMAVGISIGENRLYHTVASIIPAGVQKRKAAEIIVSADAATGFNPAVPHHVCLFWRDFPGEGDTTARTIVQVGKTR